VLYTGHTQKNGAVSKVSLLIPHHSFVRALYIPYLEEEGNFSTYREVVKCRQSLEHGHREKEKKKGRKKEAKYKTENVL
jgi:hypothetical protein